VVAEEPLLRVDDDEDAVAVIYERQGVDLRRACPRACVLSARPHTTVRPFGAHSPLDVLVGAVMGYEFGLFSAGLLAKTRPAPPSTPVSKPFVSW
jgi:hypothetical protein